MNAGVVLGGLGEVGLGCSDVGVATEATGGGVVGTVSAVGTGLVHRRTLTAHAVSNTQRTMLLSCITMSVFLISRVYVAHSSLGFQAHASIGIPEHRVEFVQPHPRCLFQSRCGMVGQQAQVPAAKALENVG